MLYLVCIKHVPKHNKWSKSYGQGSVEKVHLHFLSLVMIQISCPVSAQNKETPRIPKLKVFQC